jgi:pimeloyl-ACP methyl ester carboxylesterase
VKFVLVPGGWQGGWVFDSVAAELRQAGHEVEAVTLSGLELDGPADPDRPPNLDTHIDQVAELVAAVLPKARAGRQPDSYERVVLCGHSYAGLVIAGVADRLGDRLARLVYIDAYVPADGDSCWSLTSDPFRDLFIAGSHPNGRWVAVPEGLDPRARPHPLPSFLQAITLKSKPAVPRTFISGGPWPGTPFGPLTDRLRDDPTWDFHEIPVGHNIARRDPQALAAVLAALPSID